MRIGDHNKETPHIGELASKEVIYAQINKGNPKTLNLSFWRKTTAIPLFLIIQYHKDTIKAYFGFEYVVQTQIR